MAIDKHGIDITKLGLLDRLIYFCLTNKLVVFLVLTVILLWGVVVAPFDWDTGPIPRDSDSRWFGPVAVDAIPDIGENQQIVFTRWMGRSPQDVEDQVSYPLTVAMLGIPSVKTVRSYSMFGFSTIYIIFKEDVDFYWSRSRVLEKLNSLPSGSLPESVQPMLGPDATALGQIYWYTLEGRDRDGNPTGGWDLHELRSIQDWQVRYPLLSADGISEVASVGGFVQEYQIDVDPDAMRAYGVSLDQVFAAVKMSNLDVGARTIEVNKAEYVIRGVGFIRSVKDLESTVISERDNIPVFVRNVASVGLGPALRRGALDKGGAEVVGGVAVVRYGENPLSAIKKLKDQVRLVAPSLPEKAVVDFNKISAGELAKFAEEQGFTAFDGAKLNQHEWTRWLKSIDRAEQPSWIKLSKVTIVPFYDRTGLIHETLNTLKVALSEEILVTIIVIVIMVMHLRSSIVISTSLPLAVLICFIAMKAFKVDANIVALSGIAIAIGTIVDMGVIVCENILKHLDEAKPGDDRIRVIFNACSEVGSAVLTAILTTVVSFLPVFTMSGPEGKLFKPLAFTKTFALFASVLVALTIVPAMAHVLFTSDVKSKVFRKSLMIFVMILGIFLSIKVSILGGLLIIGYAVFQLVKDRLSEVHRAQIMRCSNYVAAVVVGLILTRHWLPLGPERSFVLNALVVMGPIFMLLGFFALFVNWYAALLKWFLDHKLVFLILPVLIVIGGALAWSSLGKEFMPPLDEGSYLYMPTTMPHASIGEVRDVLAKQDMAFNAIPEVESAVGKLGRAETPLDPAPISMIETVINYKPEYITRNGERMRYRFDPNTVDFFRDEAGKEVLGPDGKPYKVQGRFARKNGQLMPDDNGVPFRNWRLPLDPKLNPGRQAWPGITRPDDIWDRIIEAGQVPGTTSAPKLQPIAARIVMLQSGMRAPMGIKVKGPDLQTIEAFSLELERLFKSGDVPGVKTEAVIADRIVGKPYLEIRIDREAAARYGVSVKGIQNVIEIAVGGKRITTTVEGRERYPVRVRYKRELRDRIESLRKILAPSRRGQHVPLQEVAKIEYIRGPQMIKSEDTELIGYVLLDSKKGFAEVDIVEAASQFLKKKEASGELQRPAGVTYKFAGNYENQIRASKKLAVVLPLALFIIFLILYFQFKSIPTTMLVFSGIIVAWAGGFILIWLYGQDWFMDFSIVGIDFRDLFQIRAINLSVAIWVGFLALFGIASDDGVVMATYLKQSMADHTHKTTDAIREAIVAGANRRIRPCLMTTATTILALLPVLTSTGRGSDIMLPMAIPSFGGMLIEVITMFVVPVLYCLIQEWKLQFAKTD